MKICTKCGTEKDLNAFSKRAASRDGIRYECRECARDYRQIPEVKNSTKDRRFKRLYGISFEKIKEMYDEQNKMCLICKEEMSFGGNDHHAMMIDHDHITKDIRGLLCGRCNKGIGLFNDNIGLLQNAIYFLINSKARFNK